MEDNCEIVAQLPEMNNIGVIGGAPNTTTTLPASWRAAEFCHRESPFLTQLKATASIPFRGSMCRSPGRSAAPRV
jgi:hypothetical protein